MEIVNTFYNLEQYMEDLCVWVCIVRLERSLAQITGIRDAFVIKSPHNQYRIVQVTHTVVDV